MQLVASSQGVEEKTRRIAELFAECEQELGTTHFGGHPKQIDAARMLFEIYPHIKTHLKVLQPRD
jgi:hypothetical protein